MEFVRWADHTSKDEHIFDGKLRRCLESHQNVISQMVVRPADGYLFIYTPDTDKVHILRRPAKPIVLEVSIHATIEDVRSRIAPRIMEAIGHNGWVVQKVPADDSPRFVKDPQ